MFLRVGCLLPAGLSLKQRPFSEAWMSVEDLMSAILDRRVRAKGWHFMWLEGSCSRSGMGRTEQSAVGRAMTLALNQIKSRFNAAEVDSIRVSKYLGFCVAKITLFSRQIQEQTSLVQKQTSLVQEQTSLGLVDEMTIRQPRSAEL
jgi:hypothetical protein